MTVEVWDAHHHHGTKIADLLTHSEYPPDARDGWMREEADFRAEQMTLLGVSRAVLMPTNAYPKRDGIADTRHANDIVLRRVQQDPDRFLGALAIAEPQHGPASLDEIHRVHDAGAIGLMYHPRFQGVQADDPWVRRQLELAAELDMIVFFHSYADSALESPTLMHIAFRGLDDLRIVVLDGMSSHLHTSQCIALAEQHPNIVFDTALLWGPIALHHFLDSVGSDRLVFGSNVYSFGTTPCMYTPSRLREAMAGDEASLNAVLHDNLARVLRCAP